MSAELIEQPQSEGRREARTNLFAMATIYTDAGSMPVKVRNLSANGVLAEGPVLPPVGALVRLCRGTLQVTGEVVWRRDGSAGVKFDTAVTVATWLPRGRALAPQQRIDEMVHEARASARGGLPPAGKDIAAGKIMTLDLLRVKQGIESLAEAFADDPAVVERYGSQLQILDVAAQTLRKLAIQQG